MTGFPPRFFYKDSSMEVVMVRALSSFVNAACGNVTRHQRFTLPVNVARELQHMGFVTVEGVPPKKSSTARRAQAQPQPDIIDQDGSEPPSSVSRPGRRSRKRSANGRKVDATSATTGGSS